MKTTLNLRSNIFHLQPKRATDKETKLAHWKRIEEEFLPKHFGLLENNLTKSGKKFLGGDTVSAADVAFFTVYNLYDIAQLNVKGIIAEFPKLKEALEATKEFGDLKNFPGGQRGTYFTSDPDHDAF